MPLTLEVRRRGGLRHKAHGIDKVGRCWGYYINSIQSQIDTGIQDSGGPVELSDQVSLGEYI